MKLRWGILGVAKINERIVPAFAKAQRSELRAIASRSLDRARSAAQAANIPVAHGSYEALLADPTIDIVYIPLPNHVHGEWTCKAADHGKHVMCEKPLAPTADEAARVVAHCQARGVRLMDGFMWPHHPRTRHMRQAIDNGVIGIPTHVDAAFTFSLGLDPNNIRLHADMGGGSLLDVGCYPIYGIRWAMHAEPTSVWATAQMQHGVDLRMTGILKFPGNRSASFDCGFNLPFRGWMEVAGTKGVLRVPHMWLPPDPAHYDLESDDRKVERIHLGGFDQIACMLDNLSDAVAAGRDASPAPSEAVKTLRVLDALAQSTREGREVEMA